jgi:hypothetical protein
MRCAYHAWPAATKIMHFVHKACAARTAIHCVFQTASLPYDHTFSQQPEKVGKKGRSPALLLILRSSIKTGREYALPARSHSKCIHAFCPVLISGTRGAMSREQNHFLRNSFVGGALAPKLFSSRLKPTPTKDLDTI